MDVVWTVNCPYGTFGRQVAVVDSFVLLYGKDVRAALERFGFLMGVQRFIKRRSRADVFIREYIVGKDGLARDVDFGYEPRQSVIMYDTSVELLFPVHLVYIFGNSPRVMVVGFPISPAQIRADSVHCCPIRLGQRIHIEDVQFVFPIRFQFIVRVLSERHVRKQEMHVATHALKQCNL